MQEGIMSLCRSQKYRGLSLIEITRGSLYHSLNDPTKVVFASMGMLGDNIIAEPKAMIGFAGAIVIKDNQAELHPGFRAEYLLEHGMIDMKSSRKELKQKLQQSSL